MNGNIPPVPQNRQQTSVPGQPIPPGSVAIQKKQKPLALRILIGVIIAFAVLFSLVFWSTLMNSETENSDTAETEQTSSAVDNDEDIKKAPEPEQSSDSEQTPAEVQTEPEQSEPDFSDLETEYTLTAGQYYAGIDIPCGKFNLSVLSGKGNISSSNIYSGGINGLFAGPGEGQDYYKEAYNGIKMPEGERIEICDNLVVQIEYTRIDAGFSGRTEDTANTITLIDGNYDVGVDIPEGLYTIRIVQGKGNLAYNVYGGGLNEIMGEPGTDQSILSYIPEFKNAWFPAGNELTIRGMTVELIPMIPGYNE